MLRTIDLNADLGEGCPWDAALLDRVTSASLCCGAHAGDPETIARTLRRAEERGVIVGAHPGYPDREGFGRRDRPPGSVDVRGEVLRQFEDLSMLAAKIGLTLRFVKPHGALYNQAQGDPVIAADLVEAVAELRLPILGLSGSLVETCASGAGIRFIAEGFADRRYRADGRLVPRTEPGAILHEPAEIRDQVLALVDRGIQTLCIHGDNPRSVELADLVLATLKGAGIEPRGFA